MGKNKWWGGGVLLSQPSEMPLCKLWEGKEGGERKDKHQLVCHWSSPAASIVAAINAQLVIVGEMERTPTKNPKILSKLLSAFATSSLSFTQQTGFTEFGSSKCGNISDLLFGNQLGCHNGRYLSPAQSSAIFPCLPFLSTVSCPWVYYCTLLHMVDLN